MKIKIYAFNDVVEAQVKEEVIKSKGYETQLYNLNNDELAIDLIGISDNLNIYTANYLLIATKITNKINKIGGFHEQI